MGGACVIDVLEPGMLTTFQDAGREGFGLMGVSPSGAADPVSMKLGNRLVGNSDCAAAIEMTLLGGTFAFPEGGVIALTGSDFGASVPMWRTVELAPGDVVKLGHTRTGARCYMCVAGGIDTPEWLGSASAHLMSGLGGGLIRKGDRLALGERRGTIQPFRVEPGLVERLTDRSTLRVTPGLQRDWFGADALSGVYRVTEEANRVGIRLAGPPIAVPQRSMLSEGAPLGAVQVPPNGQPILLGVEQQTAGGYPKIANVISADVHRMGQLRPRDEVRFEWVSFEDARRLLIEQEELLRDGIQA